jgi:hypothetical protein
MRLSIDRPVTVDDPLLERLLAIPTVKQRYHGLLREFMDKHFTIASLEGQIDEAAALIARGVFDERGSDAAGTLRRSVNGRGASAGWAIDIGLKQFIEGRVPSVNEQLAGKAKGERPSFGINR